MRGRPRGRPLCLPRNAITPARASGRTTSTPPSPWRRLEHPESGCRQQPINVLNRTARSGQVEEMPSKPSLAEARIRSVGEWEHQSLLHKHARWIVIKPEAFAPDITRPFVKPRRFRLRNSGLKSHDAQPGSTRIRLQCLEDASPHREPPGPPVSQTSASTRHTRRRD